MEGSASNNTNDTPFSFIEAFNESIRNLEVLNAVTSGKIFRGDQERSTDDVKESRYVQQEFFRTDEKGGTTFFQVWTLFVVWKDHTMDCWMNAMDVVRGLGYQRDSVDVIRKHLSADDLVVKWEDIAMYVDRGATARQLQEEKGQFSYPLNRAPFLTEEGLYEVYQFSPKCKSFRRTVANMLKYFRQKISGGLAFVSGGAAATTRLISDEAESDRQKLVAEHRDQLETLRAELNERAAKLEENVRRLSEEKEALRNENADLHRRANDLSEKVERLERDYSDNCTRYQALLFDKTRLEECVRDLNAKETQLRSAVSSLNAEMDQKRRDLQMLCETFSEVAKVYCNPRNVSLVDGLCPIAKEPCIFFTHFGKLLVEDDYRDGFCILRRQRGGLARVNMFAGPNNEINASYPMMAILTNLCQPPRMVLDKIELPIRYQHSYFLEPDRDHLLNEHERFFLLNTSNAVSFVNMLIDQSWMIGRPRRTIVNYKRKREESDDEARCTRELIERIVARKPALRLALTLKRYKYRLPDDASSLQTFSTIFYSSVPTATGSQIKHAIMLLWHELSNALERRANDKMRKRLRAIMTEAGVGVSSSASSPLSSDNDSSSSSDELCNDDDDKSVQ
jgi:prophage antirepressor-like protein